MLSLASQFTVAKSACTEIRKNYALLGPESDV